MNKKRNKKEDNEAMFLPGRYKHYKGDEYIVFGIAHHPETGEKMVVCRPIEDSFLLPVEKMLMYRPIEDQFSLMIRSLNMFFEEIDDKEYKYKGPRFKLIDGYVPIYKTGY